MPIILLVRTAPLGISRLGLEFLKEMQGEGGEADMAVLFLAPGAFDVFAGEEPGLLYQIDISGRDSTGQIAILPEDSAGIVGGQRLEFINGDFGHKMASPYFSPHKNAGS